MAGTIHLRPTLPNCKEKQDTYAYSLEEELTMMDVVPEPAATIIALFAFAGLGGFAPPAPHKGFRGVMQRICNPLHHSRCTKMLAA